VPGGVQAAPRVPTIRTCARNDLDSENMAKRRQERVSERIHHEVSDLLQNEIRDPRLAYVTVTDVEISPDLELATIFVSTLGEREALDNAIAGLERATGYIRRELAQRLGMRVMPAVRFLPDQSWERGARLDALLDRLAGTAPPAEDGYSTAAGETDVSPKQQSDLPNTPLDDEDEDCQETD